MAESLEQMSSMRYNDPRSWVEINTDAVKHNFDTLKGLLQPAQKFGAVVKSNAYGHGLVGFSKLMDGLGSDWLIVDVVPEAVRLREEAITRPILVLGFTPTEHLNAARQDNISITISSLEHLRNLASLEAGSPLLKVHLKINTGMNRQGISPDSIDEAVKILKKLDGVKWEGIYTHLAEATKPGSEKTIDQLKRFRRAKAGLGSDHDLLEHAGATAGTMEYNNFTFDLARFGIGLYGMWPSKDLKSKYSDVITLKPALTWKSRLSEVKSLPQGQGIGYGFTEKLERDSQVAICPVGYWHGYPIHLSRKGKVMIGGRSAKVLGRVTMDMIILDVTDIESPKPGDEVTLVGGKRHPDTIAKETGSINYEVVTRINPLIERRYV